MSYSLRNIIIGFIAVLAVVLLILFFVYSTLVSQEKEQIRISEARMALRKLEPAINNVQELQMIATNISRQIDASLLSEYQRLVEKIRKDSVELTILAQQVPEDKDSYLQLATIGRQVTDTCDRIVSLAQQKISTNIALHSPIIDKFKTLAATLEARNRDVLNTSYSNSIGYTRRTFTFVRLSLLFLAVTLLFSFIFIRSDIRNRRRVEEQLKQFNTALEKQVSEKTGQVVKEKELSDSIINSLPAAFILHDSSGKFLRWNRELEKISGYSPEEIARMNALDFFTGDHRDQMADVQQAIFATGMMQSETIATMKDGRKLPFFYLGSRIEYEGEPCIIATGIDITLRKKIERENERIRYLLNERVKELSTLYRCSQILQTERKPLPQLLQELVSIIPAGWQYPDITAAKIQLGDAAFTTSNYSKSPNAQSAAFTTDDGTQGLIEVVYLEERAHAAEGPFSAEERDLINMLADLIKTSLARREESEKLKKSEANLHTIFDITDTIYILFDNNFQVISYNKRAIEFTRTQLHREIDTLRSDYMHHFSPEREPVLADWLKRASPGDHVSYEQSFAPANGSTTWYSIRMFPITGAGNTTFGLMLAVTDITGHKIAEQEVLDREIQDQKKITRAVLQAQEKERNKIGQELHDNVNQILASTKLYLGMAISDYKDEHGIIKQAVGFLEDAIAEIRKLSSKEVSPVKDIELRELIQALVDQVDRGSPVSASFRFNVTDESIIDDDLKLNIYRIVQEKLNNILKHADAKNVSILLEEKDNMLWLLVNDDGIGFNPMEKRKGIGISNIINRVKSYNGDISYDSTPGTGTRMQIRIPLM